MPLTGGEPALSQVAGVRNDLSSVLRANQALMQQLLQVQALRASGAAAPAAEAAVAPAAEDSRPRIRIRPLPPAASAGSCSAAAAVPGFASRRASRKAQCGGVADMEMDTVKAAPPALEVPVFRPQQPLAFAGSAGPLPGFSGGSPAGSFTHSPAGPAGFQFSAGPVSGGSAGSATAASYSAAAAPQQPFGGAPASRPSCAPPYNYGEQAYGSSGNAGRPVDVGSVDPRAAGTLHYRSNSCPVNFPFDLGPMSPLVLPMGCGPHAMSRFAPPAGPPLPPLPPLPPQAMPAALCGMAGTLTAQHGSSSDLGSYAAPLYGASSSGAVVACNNTTGDMACAKSEAEGDSLLALAGLGSSGDGSPGFDALPDSFWPASSPGSPTANDLLALTADDLDLTMDTTPPLI